MLKHSLGSKQRLVFSTDAAGIVDRPTIPAKARPLAEDEKTDLVRFLTVGEKVTARMAVECSMSVNGDERVGLADIAGQARRFGAMLSHYLARQGYNAKLLCGSREMRTVALLHDKLSRIDRMASRIAFLSALQNGMKRHLRSELPRINEDCLQAILYDLLADMDRRDRRLSRIRRMLARSQRYEAGGTTLVDEPSDVLSIDAGDERWTRVH